MNPLADVSVQPPQAAPAPLAQPGAVPDQIAVPDVPEPLNRVVAGQIPAIPVPPVQPGAPLEPAQQFVVENYQRLPQLNLGVYEASDLTTVVFNTSVLDESMLAEADAAGALPQLLAGPAAPEETPAMGAADVAQVRAEQRPQMPVQTAPAAPSMPAPKMPAGTAALLAKARVRNLGAGPQTPGIKPNPLSGAVAKRPV